MIKSTTIWHCINCGEMNTYSITSDLPEHFDSSIDKQWIINVRCPRCYAVSMLYRNRMEVVQICQRITPTNEYEEGGDDGIQ